MAIQTMEAGAVREPTGGAVLVNILYDDVSLLITGVQYQNTTTRDAAVVWSGHTFTLGAGTALRTQDISAFGQHVTMKTGVHGNTYPMVPGSLIELRWPAT
jgi:hypothetical protein